MSEIPECDGVEGAECETAISASLGMTGKPLVPDQNGKRFCRTCNDFIPVEKFNKTGSRRFYCQYHVRTLFRKRGPLQLASINLRKRLRRDIKQLFGQKAIKLSQNQILALLEQNNKTLEDYHEVCLLPRVPAEPVTSANVFLATKEQHQFLLALYKMTGETSVYQRSIKTMVDENMAVATTSVAVATTSDLCTP